jgi:endonuclease/exonuclease/phosphatase family metal-dependent hydrolase
MKILSFNAGYFLGYDGSRKDYLCNPLKGLVGTRQKYEKKRISKFQSILEEHDIVVILAQEVDQGSMRSRINGQIELLNSSNDDNYSMNSQVKYSGLLGSLPLLGGLSNGILYKKGVIENHYLQDGKKSLVQILNLDDIRILSVHLARLSSEMRMKQLEEINEIIPDEEDFLVAGDFNFHQGEKEITEACDILDCEAITAGATFPSSNPDKTLDLGLISRGIEAQIKVLDKQISDHRPILIELPDY